MENARLYATKANPVPDGAECGFFTGVRGRKLRHAIFRHTGETARGTILLLQGRNESVEKYFETVDDLRRLGFSVATFDLRGQGGSERLMRPADAGHVRRFRDYGRDTELFIEQMSSIHHLPRPFFIVAHSTGALIALSLARHMPESVARMVLCAPFIGLAGQILPQPAIRVITETLCLLGLGKLRLGKDQRERTFAGNPLGSDAARFSRNAGIAAEHPELYIGKPTALWIRETLRAAARVTRQDYLTDVTVPTVLMAPVLDPITPYGVVETMSRRFRACQLIPVTGARHELLQERDLFRAQTLAAIDAFLVSDES